ncbi:MAG TPA: ferredoxin family protein [Nitrososphaeraceae archaeon]|nr:ferredoxin family protein [Nitrososphaeraceae archaeon]
MSVFLKDRVWVMLSEISKRGVYPLHGYKLGIFRLPVNLTEESTINNILNELKKTGFKLDRYADRIYVTHTWKEQETDSSLAILLSISLDITVEIVTGEVIDLIYQIKPIEKFGDSYRINNYRQKADLNAKMVIDTIIRNTSIGDKLIAYYQKTEKLSLEKAVDKLSQLTPLALNPITRNVNPPPLPAGASISSQEIASSSITPTRPSPNIPNTPSATTMTSGNSDTTISLTGSGTDHSKVDGPIDTSFKSKRQKAGKFKGISVWGPIDPPGQLGIWGDSVAVDFDICIGDGACIEACPVNVYEWLDTPGHEGSERKPFMAREKDCIFCLACENVCPPQAIKIFVK